MFNNQQQGGGYNQPQGGGYNQPQGSGRQSPNGGPGGNLSMGKIAGIAAIVLFVMNYFGIAPELVSGAIKFGGVAVLFALFILPMFTKSRGNKQNNQGNQQGGGNNRNNGGW